ncbi:MAG: signal peptidase II [Pseudohongiellaceae bacterium]
MTEDYKRQGFQRFTFISVLILAVSQLGSYLVTRQLSIGETLVVTEFLHLTHIRNLGGVFGVFQGQGWFFGLISAALIVALILYLWKSREVQPYEFVCFGFIAGGGGSNVLDRLVYGSVVDFINVQGIPYWHYIFNTADVMVHVGLWPLIFMSLRQARNESRT